MERVEEWNGYVGIAFDELYVESQCFCAVVQSYTAADCYSNADVSTRNSSKQAPLQLALRLPRKEPEEHDDDRHCGMIGRQMCGAHCCHIGLLLHMRRTS